MRRKTGLSLQCLLLPSWCWSVLKTNVVLKVRCFSSFRMSDFLSVVSDGFNSFDCLIYCYLSDKQITVLRFVLSLHRFFSGMDFGVDKRLDAPSSAGLCSSPRLFPEQMGHIVSPAYYGSTLSSPCITCPENLQKNLSRWHPHHIP